MKKNLKIKELKNVQPISVKETQAIKGGGDGDFIGVEDIDITNIGGDVIIVDMDAF